MHRREMELIEKVLLTLLPMYFLTALIMVPLAAFGWVSWQLALPIIIFAVLLGVFFMFCAIVPPHDGSDHHTKRR